MPIERAMLAQLAAASVGAGRTHAPRWLRGALDAYEAWPANPIGDLLRAQLRGAGGKVPRKRVGKVPHALLTAGVTAKEAQVPAKLVGAPTNAEIARELFLSARTVETHVSSLLRELGAHDRAALAALAAEVTGP